MKKNSLNKTGLSLSHAQSISNLCYQRAVDIDSKLRQINNFESKLSIDGKDYIAVAGNKMPADIIDLITRKALLHSTQAFLMENIKAKDAMISLIKMRLFDTKLEQPAYPDLKRFIPTVLVNEQWGIEQLTESEINEFIEQEALASHIGLFIHKGSILDKLRVELPDLGTLDWINVRDDQRTPIQRTIHHTIDGLSKVYEDFSALHRKHESRVNYFKAKIKNLVTLENARISAENAQKQSEINTYNSKLEKEYETKYSEYMALLNVEKHQFEQQRQKDIQEAAALRINVDVRFKPIIDEFLKQVEDKE